MSSEDVFLNAKVTSAFRRNVWPVSILLLLVGVIFHGLPSGYWRGDDPSILWHAINSEGFSAFYDPSDWKKLSTGNLTPWVTLSFKVDLWLSGFSPKFFYVHQLGSLGMVAVAAYALCRQWVSPTWAFLSICLFLVGAPTISVTEMLMTRHYLEGLLFALLATLACVYAFRQRSMSWAFAGAFAYALAATSKEIYVPLVLVILVIPPLKDISSRLRLASPIIGTAVCYIFWRQHMLGGMIGGYVESNSIVSIQSVKGMFNAIGSFPRFIFGDSWILPTFLFCITLMITLFKNSKSIPVFIMLSIGVFVPLVPLISFPGISGPNRYLFLFWFVASLVYVFSIQTVSSLISSDKKIQYGIGILLCLTVITSTAFHTRVVAASLRAYQHEVEVQGRFLFDADKQVGFIPSKSLLNSYWYVSDLCNMKEYMGLECPVALIKGVPVNSKFDRLYSYDTKSNSMIDISSEIDEILTRNKAIDTSRPLFGTVSLENGWGLWSFGPYDNGQYFLFSSRLGRYPLPKTGKLRTPITEMSFHIQYESPDGWTTSSPLLKVQYGRTAIWEREAAE